MTRAFCDDKFTGFDRPFIKTTFVCFKDYDETIPNKLIAFEKEHIVNTFGEYLAKCGKTQLRLAETEKYAHVTFFFNGGVEEPNVDEARLLVNSPKDVATYDLKPEMSAPEVGMDLVEAIKSDKYDVIVINFANPDMVGHTGVIPAAVQAIETVDGCVGRAVEAVKEVGGQTCTAVLLDNSLGVQYSGNVPAASHILRAADGFYLLTDSTVECFNKAGEFQWTQPMDAKPQAGVLNGRQLLVFSGNTVQQVTAPEPDSSSAS